MIASNAVGETRATLLASGKLEFRTRVGLAAAALALSLPAAGAQVQDKWPSRPIRLMTPFAPGGGSDIMARALSPLVSESIGQTIVVDNRPGGGGTLGASLAVNAAPDGYTFILVSGSYGANAALHDLPYDSVTGITPIILIGETGLIVTMNPKSPVKSIKDLIAYAKANPGNLHFGSAGVGGLGHLSQELFQLMTKVKLTHVPYKGSGPVMNALLSGEVQSSFSSLVPSIPHIKAGRLYPIGITTPKRNPAVPDVPSISETVPGYAVTHWYGIWGPKGIPKNIVTRMNQEFGKVIRSDAISKWLANEGMIAAGGPPEQFFNRIKSDVAQWKRVVKEAGISVNK
ncbi:MAG: tripartite tricarboxylate transporter substrate binding protein [Betaproteobacteria bacterium]|nr:tripartite tricarboxylate transporter substrate binding protein [Betaproteobacteria bacterium]